MTAACPFLSAGLLKWLRSMTERRRYGAALASFSYFAIAYAVIALLQGAVKWQYSYWYSIDTTWNAVETFYWAVSINAVYIWQVRRNTTAARYESNESGDRGLFWLYAIGRREQQVDEIGVWIRYSLTALVCLSFVSQMFIPAYGLIMPLMGDGVCMIALLVVYIALQKLRTAENSRMEQQ
ncbi:MAG: hypothetical protein LIP11_15390 [Clostridiales bacterium]|nr:hypothetical protein [Clostridiales bacterium]